MGVLYTFEDMQDMIEHFQLSAKRERLYQDEAKGVNKKVEYGSAAAAYEYVVMVMEHSNLINGRIIMVDDDLGDAKDALEAVLKQLADAESELSNCRDNIRDKMNQLEGA